MVTLNELREGLEALGISRGDVLHMHSSMRSLGPVEKGFAGVVEVFQDLVDQEGLFSVPTHTWLNVVSGQPVYHASHTPSNLGAFPNYILSRSDFRRSLHPTHSVAAWGGRTEAFLETALDSPCPPGGSYDKLKEWGGKVVLFGVDLTRCTFFHCLEEIAGLGDLWSLGKPFEVYVLDKSDNMRVVSNYRPHKDCKSDSFYRIDSDLQREGILTQGFVGPSPVKIVDAVRAAEWLIPRLKKEPRFFW